MVAVKWCSNSCSQQSKQPQASIVFRLPTPSRTLIVPMVRGMRHHSPLHAAFPARQPALRCDQYKFPPYTAPLLLGPTRPGVTTNRSETRLYFHREYCPLKCLTPGVPRPTACTPGSHANACVSRQTRAARLEDPSGTQCVAKVHEPECISGIWQSKKQLDSEITEHFTFVLRFSGWSVVMHDCIFTRLLLQEPLLKEVCCASTVAKILGPVNNATPRSSPLER